VQCVAGLCEQRGEDDPSWQGGEDLRVVLFRPGFGGRSEACCQDIELTMRVLELPIHEADVSAGGFCRSCRNLQRGLRNTSRTCAALKRRIRLRSRSLATVVSRMRLALPGVGTSSQRSSTRRGRAWLKVTPKLLAHTVCEPVALGAPFAEKTVNG
jgi:hypothetical protein